MDTHDWPLFIHRTFWSDWAFIKWQALRRNPHYQRQVAPIYKLNPQFFEGSAISHLLGDYRPRTESNNYNPILCSKVSEGGFRYSVWRGWAMNESAMRKKSTSLEVEIHERLFSRTFTSKRFNCWPVSPKVCFPHPDFLDQIRPLPFAVPGRPLMQRQASHPYEFIVETGLKNPKYLGLDNTLHKQVLRREVIAYLNQLQVVIRGRRQVVILKPVLSKVMAQIPRRAISIHDQTIPYWFAAWDLKQQRMSFSRIAGKFWPEEHNPAEPGPPAGEKDPAVQRAQDYHALADSLINSLIIPSDKSRI